MQEIERQIAELTSEIEAAWKDASYPGDTSVSAGWDMEEEIQREMLGKHWREVSREFAQHLTWDDGIDQLRPAAFCYYLPVFLIVALTSATSQEAMVRLLTPPTRDWRDAWSLERFWQRVDPLTETQKRLFGKLLVHWRERDWLADEEWANALEYWEPYLPETPSR